jgi:uncharacterized protein YndB with AHSA1/START domain
MIHTCEPLQVVKSTDINAPVERVWGYIMDINKIPEFHPRVSKVHLLSGTSARVSYKCEITAGRGKGTCVETISGVVPMERFTTAISEDSWGLSKRFESYTVDTVLKPLSPTRTRVTIEQHYAPRKLSAKLFNLVARRIVARQTADTLAAIKRAIEAEAATS